MNSQKISMLEESVLTPNIHSMLQKHSKILFQTSLSIHLMLTALETMILTLKVLSLLELMLLLATVTAQLSSGAESG